MDDDINAKPEWQSKAKRWSNVLLIKDLYTKKHLWKKQWCQATITCTRQA
jgi:hypothetical protein